jgi:hypothetical protein
VIQLLIDGLLEEKRQQEQQKKQVRDNSQKQWKEQMRANVKALTPVMERIHSAFSKNCHELRKGGYCATIVAPPGIDARSGMTFTQQILLGGVWQKTPMKPCKNIGLTQLERGSHVCDLGSCLFPALGEPPK